MQVKQIMTTQVATCRPDMNLSAIAKLMWDNDCGFVPVIDASGTVTGVITDRDICIAAATRRMPPERIPASQLLNRDPVHTIGPEDAIENALAAMKQFQIRRLPVVTAEGRLAGVVSMNDIVLAAGQKDGPNTSDVVSALSGICAHRRVPAAA